MQENAQLFVDFDAAVRGGRVDASRVAREVGANAASWGLPLHEVLDRVERAYAGAEPQFAAVRAAAVAWADRAMLHVIDAGCEDPLTSLSTVQHARTRLGELYRAAAHEGRSAARSHAVVVVEFSPAANGLQDALRSLEVADVLRGLYPGDETLIRLSRRRIGAVVRRRDADELQVHLLARLLEDVFADHPEPRLWVERLPAEEAALGHLLAELSR